MKVFFFPLKKIVHQKINFHFLEWEKLTGRGTCIRTPVYPILYYFILYYIIILVSLLLYYISSTSGLWALWVSRWWWSRHIQYTMYTIPMAKYTTDNPNITITPYCNIFSIESKQLSSSWKFRSFSCRGSIESIDRRRDIDHCWWYFNLLDTNPFWFLTYRTNSSMLELLILALIDTKFDPL